MTQRAAARGRAALRGGDRSGSASDYDGRAAWPWVGDRSGRRSRWPPWSGPSGATTGGRTGCSTTGCSPPRPPPRSSCCGWSSGTRVARAELNDVRRRTAQESLQGPQRRADRLAEGPRQREPDPGRPGRGARPRTARTTSTTTSTTTSPDGRPSAARSASVARGSWLADDTGGRASRSRRPSGRVRRVAGAPQDGPRRRTTAATTSSALEQVIGAEGQSTGESLRHGWTRALETGARP